MKQFLEYIVPNLVNHPEDVVISEEEKDGMVVLTIKAHPDDIGRVIGKSGKIIKSLRQIVKVLAIKQGVRANIEVADSQNQPIMSEGATEEASDDMDVDVSADDNDDDLLVPEASDALPEDTQEEVQEEVVDESADK
jgi:uncharacterized protein